MNPFVKAAEAHRRRQDERARRRAGKAKRAAFREAQIAAGLPDPWRPAPEPLWTPRDLKGVVYWVNIYELSATGPRLRGAQHPSRWAAADCNTELKPLYRIKVTPRGGY